MELAAAFSLFSGSAREAETTGFRCDLPAVGYRLVKDQNALLSYAHDADAMSIDPASTAGPGWDAFLTRARRFHRDPFSAP